MLRDGAERAAARAAADGGDAEAEHVQRGNWLVVFGMLATGKWQGIKGIHLLRRQRRGGWLDDDMLVAVRLIQRDSAVVVVVFQLERRLDEKRLVLLDFFKGRQPLGIFRRDADSGGAADAFQWFIGVQTAGNFDHGEFAHAVNEQICLGVQEDGTAEGVCPKVVMGRLSERCFDTAENDRQAGEGGFGEIRIDDGGAVGALSRDAAGRACIVAPFLAEGGVMAEEGVHGACAEAAEKARTAHPLDVVRRVPSRLVNDADLVSFAFQQPCQQWDAEAWMIDVGVSGDEQDVERLPMAAGHFLLRRRKEFV